MSWNQRNARFYACIKSARQNDEVVLGSAVSGLSATMAGEHGALEVSLYTVCEPDGVIRDHFQIDFQPWRKSSKGRGSASVRLLHGILNFDDHSDGRTMVKVDREFLETAMFLAAKEQLLEETLKK